MLDETRKVLHECISFDSSRQLSFQRCTREASPAAAAAAAAVTTAQLVRHLPRPSSSSLFPPRKMAGGVAKLRREGHSQQKCALRTLNFTRENETVLTS